MRVPRFQQLQHAQNNAFQIYCFLVWFEKNLLCLPFAFTLPGWERRIFLQRQQRYILHLIFHNQTEHLPLLDDFFSDFQLIFHNHGWSFFSLTERNILRHVNFRTLTMDDLHIPWEKPIHLFTLHSAQLALDHLNSRHTFFLRFIDESE